MLTLLTYFRELCSNFNILAYPNRLLKVYKFFIISENYLFRIFLCQIEYFTYNVEALINSRLLTLQKANGSLKMDSRSHMKINSLIFFI